MEIIEIDGSQGEGGGQILRTSLALSLLLGQGFRLRNIRANRPKPGLQAQHLTCVNAAAEIGQAHVTGATKGSCDLRFTPGPVAGGHYHFLIGTAGSTSLVLHTIFLPLALAKEPSEVVIEGGTHVPASPCFHFLETTWKGYMELLGLHVRLKLKRPGFYPRGGGCLVVNIQPVSSIQEFHWQEENKNYRVTGFSAVADLPFDIAKRQASRVLKRLEKMKIPTTISEETWSNGPGTVVGLTLSTKPVPTLFFALGARGKRAEKVADEAADQLQNYCRLEHPGVDEHSADQLILPLVFSRQSSDFPVSRISNHLVTNVQVIQAFLSRSIKVIGETGQPGKIQIVPLL